MYCKIIERHFEFISLSHLQVAYALRYRCTFNPFLTSTTNNVQIPVIAPPPPNPNARQNRNYRPSTATTPAVSLPVNPTIIPPSLCDMCREVGPPRGTKCLRCETQKPTQAPKQFAGFMENRLYKDQERPVTPIAHAVTLGDMDYTRELTTRV